MKIKHTLFAMAIGWISFYVGAGLRLSDTSLSGYLLNASVIFLLGGGLAFLYKLSTHPKVKEFLNF